MSKDVAVTRRAFLGVSAAIVGAGAGLPALLRPKRGEVVRFDRLRAFPDAPISVEAELRGLPEDTVGQVTLYVTTPRETLATSAGEVRFRGGRAEFETTLAYPYETRVPGAYAYHLAIEVAGRRVATSEPCGYSLRDIVWFA